MYRDRDEDLFDEGDGKLREIPDDEPGPSFDSGYSFEGNTQNYGGEHYNFLNDVSSSDYKNEIIRDIVYQPLSPRLKRYFISVVNNFFSRTVLLSNQDTPGIAETHLDLALNLAGLHATKEDEKRPEFIGTKASIKSHCINFILTRARGKERERIILNRTSMENIQKMDEYEEKRERRRGIGVVDWLTGRND